MPPKKKAEPSDAQIKAAEKALSDEVKESEEPTVEDPHDDRTREVTHLSFARMRTDWHGPDAAVMHKIRVQVDNRILINFGDAYKILNDIYEVVRDPVRDGESGEIVRDDQGFPVWRRSDSGRFVEDYSKLGIKQREEFLFQITARLVDWEQQAADAWGEAMFAKGVWEEQFVEAFFEESTGRKTDESMTQRGRLGSRDERYFALFLSYYSRRADALMKSMSLLAQRLKDALYQ